MREFSWLSDEQLARRVEGLREAAHDAPRGGGNNSGSFAWASRANDWVKASNELERRQREKSGI